MSQPSVLSIGRPEPDTVEFLLAVPADCPAFAGHFPGRPILPGVVQIDWVVRLAAEFLQSGTPAAQDFQVKFSHVVEPGAALHLTLRLDRQKNSLSFEYRNGTVIASSGRIALEPAQ
ncbi:hypothetical protein [Telmatospirillum sp.]|uniref:3-hydroxyacyl-ACP dehydratase FabZ family protein n=1 Tax=Telmatospirillum sp. TaxID=2079197 RepID=UPI00284B8DA9|nr:hypothetical protein [Telmatospirillum sp.]MDR3439083.1 hypothetical protein [Telmatospirillum sp.]